LIPQVKHEGVANACEPWNQERGAGTGMTMISAKSDVQIDNPEVRVTEWRLAPGSATGHHIHEMDYVIVPVCPGEMTIVAPNGERSKAQLGLVKSDFRKAGVEHDVLNETASEIVFLEIELKP
jgi:quercetin dioxygenase-like cupin family protein